MTRGKTEAVVLLAKRLIAYQSRSK